LPVVNSISDTLKQNAVLIHENLNQYNHAVHDVYPEENTDISDRIQIRKGDAVKGWSESEVIVGRSFSLPQSDHLAMETRNARAQIMPDESINLNSGAVEIGPSTKTTLAKIFAEKLKMDVGRIYVLMGVYTQVSLEHRKTVASMTTFMAGRAVLRAADDLINQLKSSTTDMMKFLPEDLEITEEKVYLKQDPEIYVSFEDLVRGHKEPNGLAIEEQLLGRGSFIMNHII
jgi:CO/xanthine dehydrogenase Mo-binding subunit